MSKYEYSFPHFPPQTPKFFCDWNMTSWGFGWIFQARLDVPLFEPFLQLKTWRCRTLKYDKHLDLKHPYWESFEEEEKKLGLLLDVAPCWLRIALLWRHNFPISPTSSPSFLVQRCMLKPPSLHTLCFLHCCCPELPNSLCFTSHCKPSSWTNVITR